MEQKYSFEIDNETYEMTMKDLAMNITRIFAKELLNDEEFKEFCKVQESFFEDQRKKVEEYSRTHYIYNELRDAF